MLQTAFLPTEIIKKTRAQQELTSAEIQFLVTEFTAGRLPDYQMSAWLMAVFLQGLTPQERAYLTSAMLHSGETLDFTDLPGYCVDKHSTGGVGDKTSLIVGPIVAALGAYVPMISGRGLGHTGGTLDKLESIPGFKTQISLDNFRTLLRAEGLCYIGQTPEICPADKKMYALRDVTATVESLPLICASIMCKKIAEGIKGLVLDVKVGSGAFMKTKLDATNLAQALIDTGTASGLSVRALLTHMDEPLGYSVGNALEVAEVLGILQNDPQTNATAADTRELSLQLAAEMLLISGRVGTRSEGLEAATAALTSGQAFDKFARIVAAQGGSLARLPHARESYELRAQTAGYISAIHTESIGLAALRLGAGRTVMTDPIDPAAGILCHKKIGATVAVGDLLYTLKASSQSAFAMVAHLLEKATTISLQKPETPSLILKQMG